MIQSNRTYLANLTWVLTVANLRDRYLGTWAGLMWAFVNPIIMIGVFWVVFAQGFRIPTTGERPFLLLLVCALVPWMTFSEAVNGAAGSIVGRAYLVRKIAFPLELLPITQVLSALMVHGVLVVFALLIAFWYGRWPTLSMFMLPVYLFAMTYAALGLGLALASLGVAFRDILQGLGVFMNLLFWATPIVWSADMMPSAFQWFVTFNPLSFVIEGYRHALLGAPYPAPTAAQATVFWVVSTLVFVMGVLVFKRLKPSFADIL
ncbi:ABC transporter permease [Sediminicoccus sp. KRV36]|uniref:ABC transporter permease n=1 Tax=Sediminicoccus sp. KRV36 TaxID=3133721 RepID=UPI00200CA635|nr:ABC transporter permease [Sediminicoccus rosea]UPY36829.1 ABC transporter permease [Sediminicoccus rosea]